MALTIFLIDSFYIFEMKSWGRYVIIVVAFAILLITAINNHGVVVIKTEAYHRFFIAFILVCFASVVWAWNPYLALVKSITLFEIFVCMSMIYPYFRTNNDIDELIKIFMISGYILCVYTLLYYGRSEIVSYLSNNIRIGNDYTNANALGLVASMSIIIQVYYIINKRSNLWVLFLLPAVIVLAISQSRKAIVMVVLGIAFLIGTNAANKNRLKRLLNMAVALLILGLMLFVLSRVPIFEGVMRRFVTFFESLNGQRAEDIRSVFRRIGLEQFRKTPILGIGIGNSLELLEKSGYGRTYLHSNMVELLACLGIVGFIVYYSIYFYLGFKLLKYRRNNHGETNLCFVLLVMMFIMDYAQVTYYDKVQYLYFMCFFLSLL